MKTIFTRILILAALATTMACGHKSHDHEGTDDSTEHQGNQALYVEVMKIHDEGMAKMDQMYKLKRQLNEKILSTPAISEDRKKELESAIAKLDAADKGMMNWMHKFEPIGDSEGEEKAREYLEGEMEKVKEVRTAILEALEEGAETLKDN